MNKSSVFRSIIVVVSTVFLFTSCDKDFNQIGSDVIGDDHFDLLPDDLSTIVAHTRGTGVVQTNNMLINSLGIYNNPVFGVTKANFVTELQMANVNPTFELEKFIELDSVILTVPYFSTRLSTDSGGRGVYRLDSIYGNEPINLKVFESGVVLNDLAGPDFQNAQKYYSDEDTRFNDFKIGVSLNNSANLKENEKFVTNKKEIRTFKRDKGLKILDTATANIEERLVPRMRLHLNTQFFKNKIINAPAGKLVNNSVFKDYFRGLYFQVQDATTGTLMQFKFSDGDVTLHYREYSQLVEDPNNPTGPKVPTKFPVTEPLYAGQPIMTAKTFVLKMAGNTVNLLKNSPTPAYTAALLPSGSVNGDDKLFVKGGEGSLAVINLFGVDNFGNNGVTGTPNTVPDELDIIRTNVEEKGWLINEASLTFHVDIETMDLSNGNAKVREPQRLYLYDLDNKRPLIDYYSDGTTISGRPKFNKYVHDGLIQREQTADGRGVKYKVRITNHIRNLVKFRDSTNVKLGLVVTEYIENVQNAWFEVPSVQGDVRIDRVPQASVMNPFGTVLYGTGDNVPPEKRLKLEIYYTKPN